MSGLIQLLFAAAGVALTTPAAPLHASLCASGTQEAVPAVVSSLLEVAGLPLPAQAESVAVQRAERDGQTTRTDVEGEADGPDVRHAATWKAASAPGAFEDHQDRLDRAGRTAHHLGTPPPAILN